MVTYFVYLIIAKYSFLFLKSVVSVEILKKKKNLICPWVNEQVRDPPAIWTATTRWILFPQDPLQGPNPSYLIFLPRAIVSPQLQQATSTQLQSTPIQRKGKWPASQLNTPTPQILIPRAHPMTLPLAHSPSSYTRSQASPWDPR